jgi:hypothetical protein
LRRQSPLRILILTVRRMSAFALHSISALALAACGPNITDANIDVVNKQRAALDKAGKGLSPKEVEAILGQPSKIHSSKLALETQKKEVDVVRYEYKQDGKTIELHFLDNKLINEVPRLGPQAAGGK